MSGHLGQDVNRFVNCLDYSSDCVSFDSLVLFVVSKELKIAFLALDNLSLGDLTFPHSAVISLYTPTVVCHIQKK